MSRAGRPKNIIATFEVTDPQLAVKIIRVMASHKQAKAKNKKKREKPE